MTLKVTMQESQILWDNSIHFNIVHRTNSLAEANLGMTMKVAYWSKIRRVYNTLVQNGPATEQL